jgi:large subunit ribosomal protein L3
MTIGLVGRKSGMTRVFTEDGVSVPVTVVEVSPNRVTQIKALETDGYRAIQVTAGNRKASKVSKPEAGHFAKAGVAAGEGLWEFRLDGIDESFEIGAELTVARFEPGQKVDVAGQSKRRRAQQ